MERDIIHEIDEIRQQIAEEPHTRGLYAVCPHRVQGIIMLLAGVSDMVDPTHSRAHSEG